MRAPAGANCWCTPVKRGLGRYFGLRTRVLDDFLLGAGAEQVVLLGAGLDSRAHRLAWPPGCRVFELDRPDVLAFKQQVLDDLGATANARRTTVAVDLCEDWAEPLREAGFDPDVPAAWLAEGLLLYLPAEAERRLIKTLDRLAAPGSCLAYEVKLRVEHRAGAIYRSAREQIGVDLTALFDDGPRPDSAGALRARGWTTSVRTPFDLAAEHDVDLVPERDDALAANRWVFAGKGATSCSPPSWRSRCSSVPGPRDQGASRRRSPVRSWLWCSPCGRSSAGRPRATATRSRHSSRSQLTGADLWVTVVEHGT